MPRWYMTLAALIGLAIPALWLATLVVPGEEAVKVRNALVAEPGRPADFAWRPGEPPPGFLENHSEPVEPFASIGSRLRKAADGTELRGFNLGVAIARHLASGPDAKDGGPIQGALRQAYHGIVHQGQGYCADYTQVFTGLALAAGLPARTWGISFEGFGSGHAFNEVYDDDLRKWVVIDAFHSIYFVDPATGVPFSTIELHDRLLGLESSNSQVVVRRIVQGRFPFRTDDLALDYYRRGMSQLVLVYGNNVFDYDRSRMIRFAAALSRHAERATAIVTGQFPRMLVYPVALSHRDLEMLERTRTRFIAAASACFVAWTVFGWILLKLWLDRARSPGRHARRA